MHLLWVHAGAHMWGPLGPVEQPLPRLPCAALALEFRLSNIAAALTLSPCGMPALQLESFVNNVVPTGNDAPTKSLAWDPQHQLPAVG